AGIKDPRQELAMAEVHDCFTPTELVLMEDLGFAARGTAWKAVLAGTFDLDGELAVNPDGGLKSFGHPIGASGLRMMYEMWLQLRGESGARQSNAPQSGPARPARRVRPAHDVRDVAPAPRGSRRATDQVPEARPDAQPRRDAGPVRELRI